jgi:hypothetical protein
VAAASIPVGIFRSRVHGGRENLAGAAKSSEADRGE